MNIAAVLALPGQRVAIIDGLLARLTILDEHGGLLSTAPLPFATRSAVRLPDDTYVLMGQSVESISLLGHPLVRVRPDGTTRHFFGEDETEKEDPLEGTVMHRLIAWDASREAIVAVKRFKYEIELWSREGELMTTIRRDVEWFDWPPALVSNADPHLGASSPENMVRAVQVDGAGRLWVILHITPVDFDEGAWLENERAGRPRDYNRSVDSQIEVIDLDSGAVECSATFDPAVLSGFAGDRQIATYEEDGAGNPAITLWQLNMVMD